VAEGNSRSLHFAPPNFLWNLVALSHFMRPSLRKDARVALSSAVWQEIRVRFGRDDTSVWGWGFERKIWEVREAHRRSLGFPGFPVESCGFGQLHVVLFRENHISGRQ
jgi:hypothetical protein